MKLIDNASSRGLARGLIISLTLAGCSPTVWHKDGATEADFNRDVYECQRDVYAVSGPRYRPIDAAPNPNTNGLQGLGDQLGRMGFEQGIFEQCMRAKGYDTRKAK